MFSIPLQIPTYWTPEQALAVFELIDDLRERIWSIYAANLQDLTRQQRHTVPVGPIPDDTDNQPF
jgi:hypothetical protein